MNTNDSIDTLLATIDTNDKLETVLSKLNKKFGSYLVQNTISKVNETAPDVTEDILDESNHKFTTLPIKYNSIWQLYKQQIATFWKAEEIDFSGDYEDFQALNKDEQYFIEMILAFFAASDGIVNFNLSERFIKEIKNTEILYSYQFQTMMENIHCVSGDTMILTDQGYNEISKLQDQTVKVWNGHNFSETVVRYTGDSELYRVRLSNGMSLDCTPKHKWFINQDSNKTPNIVFTCDLAIGDIINSYDLPIVECHEDPDEFKNPYIHGFHCISSVITRFDKLYVTAPNNNDDILGQFGVRDMSGEHIDITGKLNKDRYTVPLNYSKDTKLEWLRGLIDANAIFQYQTTDPYIKIQSNVQEFITMIQLMLTTLGINIPFTKDTFNNYSLCLTAYDIHYLYTLGLKKLSVDYYDQKYKIKPIITVDSVQLIDIEQHATYCFNEPEHHAGVFNGILTGQSEVYSLMLNNIVKDIDKRTYLFSAIKNIDSVKMMADWAFKWCESGKSFAHRVVAFAIFEGIFFSGAFAAIFWIKKYKNKSRVTANGKSFMDGLIKSNKFIARDEGLHCVNACEVYALLENKLSQNDINEIIQEGVDITKIFMTDALPVKLIGMNSDMMCDYIEYIADRLLVMLNYKKMYGKKNPFKFMETIGLCDQSNFFETRPHEYQDAHVMNVSERKSTINISTDDF